jgi:hypothetical protein
MTSEEIIEGNKIIAEFMVPNWELLKSDNYEGGIETKDLWVAASLCSGDYKNLRYHTSYDSLFRVIDKLEEDIYNWVTLSGHRCLIEEKCPYSGKVYKKVEYNGLNSKGSKIENYWRTVVDFIKYLNEEKKSDL